MFKTRVITLVIISMLFLIALYLVEFSPYSAREVAKYNGGFGTFDMKKYDYATVSFVLSKMEPGGKAATVHYYAADYIFVLFFGLFQGYVVYLLYHHFGVRACFLAVTIPIMRGIFDIIENTLLLHTVLHYPRINEMVVRIASLCTAGKLFMIKLWVIEVLIGFILIRRGGR